MGPLCLPRMTSTSRRVGSGHRWMGDEGWGGNREGKGAGRARKCSRVETDPIRLDSVTRL